MAANDKKDVDIHIIHSMKGGCGKSACAMLKALKCIPENYEKKYAEVLFLDADFRGSAWQRILLEAQASAENRWASLSREGEEHIVDNKGVYHRLAWIEDYDEECNLNRYLRGEVSTLRSVLMHGVSFDKVTTQEESTIEQIKHVALNGYVDFILAASDMSEKSWFRYSNEGDNYKMPSITAGIFVYHMKALLKEILQYGKAAKGERGQYRDIVIDMPPGYDEYSDLLLMELRKLKGVKLHYYSVTTDDEGHMKLALDNVTDVLRRKSGYPPYKTVNIILNCIRQGEFDLSSANKKSLGDTNLVLKLQNRITKHGNLYRRSFDNTYYEFCRKGKEEIISVGADFEVIQIK